MNHPRYAHMDIRPDMNQAPYPDYEVRFPVYTILVGGVTPPFVMRLPTLRSHQGGQIIHATEAVAREIARFLCEDYDWSSYDPSAGSTGMVVDVYRNDDAETRILHLTCGPPGPEVPEPPELAVTIDSITPGFTTDQPRALVTILGRGISSHEPPLFGDLPATAHMKQTGE